MAGFDAALDRAGLIAFVANTGEDITRQVRVLARFQEQAVDGVIVCPAAGATPELLLGDRAALCLACRFCGMSQVPAPISSAPATGSDAAGHRAPDRKRASCHRVRRGRG